MFMYYSPLIWKITILFRRTTDHFTFCNTNIVYEFLTPRTPNTKNEYTKAEFMS